VLVKEQDLDIAFKKSDFNSSMDKIKIIIYINNKTSVMKRASINYEYQNDYFDIKVL
jgi:hypothetical protein